MNVYRDSSDVPDARAGRVVTIGAFDGVHLGHQAVLRLVRELADARGMRAAVVTFDRHPAEIVRPEYAPRLLTSLDQKLELLEATGAVDDCLVITFDEARSKETADEFVEELLAGAMRTRLVVVGSDFHFGYRRRGDVPLLQRMGADLGFEVLGLGLVASPDGRVAADATLPYSSTWVRNLLDAGDVAGAAAVLGRPHEVRGVVEHGDQRGRELGFPTANVAVPDRICLPSDGVYAGTYVDANQVEHPAAISLGRRPTFYEDSGMRLLEAYLLDFDGDLYDQPAAVRFRARLRGQERFESVDALVEQMGRDVEAARRILSS
ncbi:MAG: riboflavin kinase/FMN adenylyltransferase [Actinomycetia bacterium]|nr:riboflavin kinase/FMN adenylyltransferase [Actinomycetes bacterium]